MSSRTLQEVRDGVVVLRTEHDKFIDKVMANEQPDIIRLPDRVQERVIEVPHKMYQLTYVESPAEQIEVVKEVPKIITQVEYRESPPETRIVEVPEFRQREVQHTVERVVYREEFVDEIVEIPEETIHPVPKSVDVPARLPLLCEQVTQYEVSIPKIVPIYNDIVVPIYVPRIVESHLVGGPTEAEAKEHAERFGLVMQDLTGPLTKESAQAMVWNSFGAGNRPSAEFLRNRSQSEQQNKAPRRIVLPPPRQPVPGLAPNFF